MKKTMVITLALLVSFMLAGGASAMQYKSMTRTNGTAAYAEWFSENDDYSSDTYLEVDKTEYGTDVYYGSCTYIYDTDEYFCRDGYYFTTDNIFTIDKKLKTATLSEVTIELWDWDTWETEMIIVGAVWTGTGDLEKGKINFHSQFGNFSSKYRETSNYRDATATATVNGEATGTSDFGGMVNFRSAEFMMEK
ncbi:MAG: hypothetical protein V1838_02710 [Patescibacteria group bacterium]